jgi:hypothetical protein
MLPDTSLSKYIRTDGTTVDKTKEASNEIVLRLPVALGYYNLSFYNFFTCSESCSTAHPRIELTEPIEYFLIGRNVGVRQKNLKHIHCSYFKTKRKKN